jgi:hypothetical protein
MIITNCTHTIIEIRTELRYYIMNLKFVVYACLLCDFVTFDSVGN